MCFWCSYLLWGAHDWQLTKWETLLILIYLKERKEKYNCSVQESLSFFSFFFHSQMAKFQDAKGGIEKCLTLCYFRIKFNLFGTSFHFQPFEVVSSSFFFSSKIPWHVFYTPRFKSCNQSQQTMCCLVQDKKAVPFAKLTE